MPKVQKGRMRNMVLAHLAIHETMSQMDECECFGASLAERKLPATYKSARSLRLQINKTTLTEEN